MFLVIVFIVIASSIFLYISLNVKNDEIYNQKDRGNFKNVTSVLQKKGVFSNSQLTGHSQKLEEQQVQESPDDFHDILDEDDEFINNLLNKEDKEDEEDEEDEEDGENNRDKKSEEKALDDLILQDPDQFDIETLKQASKRLGNSEKGKFVHKALENKIREKDNKRER
jgi:hypothetical protein